MSTVDLLLAAAIFWTVFWALLIVPGVLLLRYSDRITAFVDAILGGERHLETDRRHFHAEVRARGTQLNRDGTPPVMRITHSGQLHAIGGGRRHLHAVPDPRDGDAA